MSIADVRRWLWSETWWTWSRRPDHPVQLSDFICHYFNLVEAFVWMIFAVLVLRRWIRLRRTPLEAGYATAFLLFGISDVIESEVLTSWLLWWKVVNVVVLFQLRRLIMHRHYPGCRLY